MAIATFKMKMFKTALELKEHVRTGDVTTVTAIVFDAASGMWVVFYV